MQIRGLLSIQSQEGSSDPSTIIALLIGLGVFYYAGMWTLDYMYEVKEERKEIRQGLTHREDSSDTSRARYMSDLR
ncbi:MAG: hypothetical protein SGJ02_07440 [bacterium]|nr:hypothetical protein [bacterium]